MTQNAAPNPFNYEPESALDLRRLMSRNPTLWLSVGAALIALMTIVAYMPAFKAGFIWDDNYYVTANRLLNSWEGLQRIWTDVIPRPAEYPLPQYYPLTYTTFWIEHRLFGFDPLVYHSTNIVLHLASALLIWLLLRKLEIPGGWLAAALFAVHPINVESVAWISERKNVLSVMFFLSALYVYLRYAGVIAGRSTPRPASASLGELDYFSLPDDPQRLYALACVLFACALFSKTITSSMPAVALLLIWYKTRQITWKQVAPLLPLLAGGVLMGTLTAYMEHVRVGIAARPQYWIYAQAPLGEFGARCVIAGHAVWFYLAKLLVPYPLMFNYPRWQVSATQLLPYLWPIGAAALLALLAAGTRFFGRGPVVAGLFFAITLFPAMGFIDVWPMQYSFVADHFVYLSGIGFFALVAAIATRWIPLESLAAGAAVVLVVFIAGSYRQCLPFHDMRTLWITAYENSGHQSWMAANNLGVYLLEHDDVPNAQRFFERTLVLRPSHPEARLNLGKIAEYRADIATRIGAIAATRPNAPVAAILPATKPAEYYADAEHFYRDAIAQQPNYVDAHFLLARLLLKLNRTSEGISELKQTIELYPRHFDAHLRLGELALLAQDNSQAIEHFSECIELEPASADAHAKLGAALLAAGQSSDGFAQWDEALRLEPDNTARANQFGEAMIKSGEYHKSIGYLQRALQIDPDYTPAIVNFGIDAVKNGFPDKGRALFNHALEIDPSFKPARAMLADLDAGRLRPATTQSATAPAGEGAAPIQ